MHSQKLSPKMLRRLVAALGQTANVSESARRVGISRVLAYKWYNFSKDGIMPDQFVVTFDDGETQLPFHEAWDAALDVATDYLELVAHRLATGYEEPLTHQGEITMQMDEVLGEMVPVTITKYDSRMLEILLKARRPEKYRERHEHRMSGKVGGVLLVPGTAEDAANWEKDLTDQQEEARGRSDKPEE